MAVRLNKALKELNVGINTVAEFLQKKGMALQDATPNAKITDEQYALLQKEFGEDMKQNVATKQKIQSQKEKELQEKKERQQAAREEKERLEREKAAKKPQLKIVGNINDLKKEAPKAEEKPVEHQEETKPAEPAPVAAKEVEVSVPEKKQEKLTPADRLEQDENGVYRLAAPTEAGVQFKQVGFIDLSTLNSKTRPDRKSKAERRKERQGAQTGDAQAAGQKKKRNRINNSKVDIDAAAKQNNGQQGQGKKQGGKGQAAGGAQPNQAKNKQNANTSQQGQGKKNKKMMTAMNGLILFIS